ncbi:DHH family phosphoesterase [Vibrio sp. dsl-7]|uniref:DHH family phosphoesterase n=1 Tax=Vibrio chanodichtyis TaxID=3027932 RepID=A0ABT5V1L3_9VIBR|nr:DHH family phosphoesterase [Vibrio chanodichtyis]MDE1515556.1 DHH family phosphoesterase [Vibrio chanodichtyis]
MHYDVFNGDADGIIALLQLRLAEPKSSRLITGVKRDIQLLEEVVRCNDVDSVTVLDISMEKNHTSLRKLLGRGIEVFYCDHHRSGEIPITENLHTLINLDAEMCTSLLINQYLNGRYVHWAIAAAFGDNLFKPAFSLAKQLNLSQQATAFLQELGTLINYNGYGAEVADLHIQPAELFRMLIRYESPFELMDAIDSPFFTLKQGYTQDYTCAMEQKVAYCDTNCEVYELPSEPWARRISGVFANQLANHNPDKAHAVLTLNPNGNDYTVSLRAPLNKRMGADELCSQFATGGGRKAAAGINKLPVAVKNDFISALTQFYTQ